MASEAPGQPLIEILPENEDSKSPSRLVNVWTPGYPHHDLTYAWPKNAGMEPQVGLRVVIPLRRQQVTGYITNLDPQLPDGSIKIRTITMVLDSKPLLPQELLRCLKWAASYYLYPFGAYIHAALPPGLHSAHRTLVRITPEGRQFLASAQAHLSGKPPVWLKILDYLNQVREAPASRIRRVLKLSNPGPAIQFLRARGLITLREFTSTGLRLPRIKVIHLVRTPELNERLSKAQRKLLDIISRFNRDILFEEIADVPEATPDRLRRLQKRGFIQIYEQYQARPLRWHIPEQYGNKIQLNEEQQAIYRSLLTKIKDKVFYPALLYGVTGSGKTEVYLELAEETLRHNRQVLILMPEIGLIPSVIERFQARFGDKLAILHSALSVSKRNEMWWRIAKQEASIVLGTRSAVFAPLTHPGLVVVDEEQDTSYKQSESPVYHARDLAIVRARMASCPVLLVSATPSVETYAQAEKGTYHRYVLPHRAIPGARLPEVQIVDMREAFRKSGDPFFSNELLEELDRTLKRKESAIVLINRRGYAVSVFCRGCGYTFECIHCSVHLFYHRDPPCLRCHYCGYESSIPRRCPQCGETKLLSTKGLGTERAVKVLSEKFPDARIARLDQDLVSRPVELFETLASFQQGKIQILVGTQMIAKGHHFPRVTLSAVLEADGAAGVPDFRSGERLFQLITQVIGRSGRGDRPGKALIQTYRPDHYAIRFACAHDYDGFFREEMKYRFRFRFPPFTHLIVITVRDHDRSRAHTMATEIARSLQEDRPPETTIDGPIIPYLWRLRGWYRFQILIRTGHRKACRDHIIHVFKKYKIDRTRVHIDVDPEQIV